MIIKRRYTANYTTIGNKLFEDERLAADELGILAFLRSRPPDWEVRRTALSRRFGMGREAIKRVVTNFVRYGWCVACKTRLPNGTYYMIYEIRDEPGATLTDEEVRRALSLVSSEAVSDEIDGDLPSEVMPVTDDPPTGYPSLADPSPGDPHMAYIDIQNKDLPRDESYQKIERERARAKEKHALNLVEFKRRWPTNASDDQAKVDSAWFALSPDEGEAALAGIAPFLENLRKDGRKHPPAGFTYLNQKRWALIDQPKGAAIPTAYPRDSAEAKALNVLHEIAGCAEGFRRIYRTSDGSVSYRKPMTAQLVALAQAPPREEWDELNRQQAGAWEAVLRETVRIAVRKHLKEGDRAPWPWPPSVEGKIYTSATGPPEVLMSEHDVENFK